MNCKQSHSDRSHKHKSCAISVFINIRKWFLILILIIAQQLRYFHPFNEWPAIFSTSHPISQRTIRLLVVWHPEWIGFVWCEIASLPNAIKNWPASWILSIGSSVHSSCSWFVVGKLWKFGLRKCTDSTDRFSWRAPVAHQIAWSGFMPENRISERLIE